MVNSDRFSNHKSVLRKIIEVIANVGIRLQENIFLFVCCSVSFNKLHFPPKFECTKSLIPREAFETRKILKLFSRRFHFIIFFTFICRPKCWTGVAKSLRTQKDVPNDATQRTNGQGKAADDDCSKRSKHF